LYPNGANEKLVVQLTTEGVDAKHFHVAVSILRNCLVYKQLGQMIIIGHWRNAGKNSKPQYLS
jgi:hypothetical protein